MKSNLFTIPYLFIYLFIYLKEYVQFVGYTISRKISVAYVTFFI